MFRASVKSNQPEPIQTKARFRMMSVLLSLLLAINPLHSAASIEGNQLPDFGDSSV